MSPQKERYWVWFCQKERFYPCTIALVFCFSFRILLGLLGRTEGERDREGKSFGLEKGECIYLIKRKKSDFKKKMLMWKIVERSKASC